MKVYASDADRRRAETMKLRWASLSPEEKELISRKHSLAAKKIWAKRGVHLRKLIGQKISESKKKVVANGDV